MQQTPRIDSFRSYIEADVCPLTFIVIEQPSDFHTHTQPLSTMVESHESGGLSCVSDPVMLTGAS